MVRKAIFVLFILVCLGLGSAFADSDLEDRDLTVDSALSDMESSLTLAEPGKYDLDTPDAPGSALSPSDTGATSRSESAGGIGGFLANIFGSGSPGTGSGSTSGGGTGVHVDTDVGVGTGAGGGTGVTVDADVSSGTGGGTVDADLSGDVSTGGGGVGTSLDTDLSTDVGTGGGTLETDLSGDVSTGGKGVGTSVDTDLSADLSTSGGGTDTTLDTDLSGDISAGGGDTDSILSADLGGTVGDETVEVGADVGGSDLIGVEASGGIVETDLTADATTDTSIIDTIMEPILMAPITETLLPPLTGGTDIGAEIDASGGITGTEAELGIEADVDGSVAGDDVGSDPADGLSTEPEESAPPLI